MTKTFIEREMLRAYTDDLRARGFDVIANPTPPALPTFFGNLRPDAIALSEGRKLVIEAHARAREAGDITLRYTQILRDHPEWDFKLIWLEESVDAIKTLTAPLEQISARNSELMKLIEDGSYDAALLLAWANLEALGRLAVPESLANPQAPRRLIEILASEGIITPTEADVLREIAPKRIAVAHGDMETKVELSDLRGLNNVMLEIAKQITEAVRTTQAHLEEDIKGKAGSAGEEGGTDEQQERSTGPA